MIIEINMTGKDQEPLRSASDTVQALNLLAEAAGQETFTTLGMDATPLDMLKAAMEYSKGSDYLLEKFVSGYNFARMSNRLSPFNLYDDIDLDEEAERIFDTYFS